MLPPSAGAEPLWQTRVIAVPDASHIGEARRAVGALSARLGVPETAAGRVAIVATELATNVAKHGGGGQLLARAIESGTGIELVAIDKGDGIDDVARAMRDGYSSGGTAGKGLGAVQRLSDVFDVYSRPQGGTAMLSQMRGLTTSPPSVTDAEAMLDVGVVCAPAPFETVSGDGWAIVGGRAGASIVMVDGLGHGANAHEAALAGLSIARENAGALPATMMSAMHAGMKNTRGAAAGVAEIDPAAQIVRFAGIGNISCAIVSSDGTRSLASMNGIVGHEARTVQQFDAPFPQGATLVMFSDGLTTRWRFDQYAGLRPRHPSLAAAVIFRDNVRGRDDATILVARVAQPRGRVVG